MVAKIGDSLIPGKPLGTSFSNVAFEDVYEIDVALNSGGYGTVHKTHLKTNRFEVYAVKVFERTGRKDDDKDVIQEAEILRQLKDVPGAVNLMDFFLADDRIYMVQELARGRDIFERIEQYGTFEESAARTIVRTLLETVDVMHTKFHLVHRDIKPENVLLRNQFSETDIVLCDFGSARYLPRPKHQGLVSRGGTTTEFSAPELLSRSEYRQEVDIWSIGCLLFVLLVGYHPFEGDDEEETSANIAVGDYGSLKDDELWYDITDDAKDIVHQMLTVDRYQRCTAHQALQHQWFSDDSDEETHQSSSSFTKLGSKPISNQLKNKPAQTQGTTYVPNYAANTANKLSHEIGVPESRNSSSNSYDLFNDQDHSDCYGSGDASETEATAFTDSCNSSFNDDVLFVMGKTRTSLLGASNHSCSRLWNLEEDDDDDDDYDYEDFYDEQGDNKHETACYYSIEQLRKKSVPGLDYYNREKYLCDKDFEKIFGATRTEVATWRQWRITLIKQEKGLW